MNFEFKTGYKPKTFKWKSLLEANPRFVEMVNAQYGDTATMMVEYCSEDRLIVFTTPMKTRPVYKVGKDLKMKLVRFAESLPLTLNDLKEM